MRRPGAMYSRHWWWKEYHQRQSGGMGKRRGSERIGVAAWRHGGGLEEQKKDLED